MNGGYHDIDFELTEPLREIYNINELLYRKPWLDPKLDMTFYNRGAVCTGVTALPLRGYLVSSN